LSWTYEKLLRPILFKQDAEAAHERTLYWLAKASHSKPKLSLLSTLFGSPPLPTKVFGLTFPNPIGLAAGMDKFGAALPAWAALGFGFTELGGVTWHAQPGNSKPRIFRAIADEAIVNRMGFNNAGAEALATTLQEWRTRGLWPAHPVGINLGKSKITPLESAAEDYANSLRVLLPHADFCVVNVSSPNTPNLRQLQDKAALQEILNSLNAVIRTAAERDRKPILVKIAPDLSFEAIDEILTLASDCAIAGIVATNTTSTRPATVFSQSEKVYSEAGGLSGKPLAARSTEVIRHIYRQTRGKLPIIGVGGIFTAEDAWEKLAAGASLLQIYTGLVYRGRSLIKEIVAGLAARLERAGLKTLSDAVGLDVHQSDKGRTFGALDTASSP
jgi:dihydroorotate dehydrogenase